MREAALFKILDVVMVGRKNLSIQTENKSCYVLSCRINGESEFSQNGNSFTVNQGDILYIPCGSSYSQKCSYERVIAIHLEALSTVSNEIKMWQLQDAEYVCSLFLKCYDAFNKRSNNYEYVCMAVLYEILSLISVDADDTDDVKNLAFDLAMQYLNTYIFEKDFSVDKLCKSANISRAYFNKLFKKIYNTTPVSHINEARIRRAKMMLESGNYTNEEIADLCGFNDVKYFYVIFKKLTGQTTLEYKNKAQP